MADGPVGNEPAQASQRKPSNIATSATVGTCFGVWWANGPLTAHRLLARTETVLAANFPFDLTCGAVRLD